MPRQAKLFQKKQKTLPSQRYGPYHREIAALKKRKHQPHTADYPIPERQKKNDTTRTVKKGIARQNKNKNSVKQLNTMSQTAATPSRKNASCSYTNTPRGTRRTLPNYQNNEGFDSIHRRLKSVHTDSHLLEAAWPWTVDTWIEKVAVLLGQGDREKICGRA